MWGFSEKDNIEGRPEVQATRKMIGFIIGLSLFMLAIFRFIPKDLFTTATWFDAQRVGMLYSGEASVFAEGSFWDITNVTVPVSEEAFWVAVMITLLQFTFGYLIGTSGSYINGGQNVENPLQFLFIFSKGQVTAKNVNWKKIGYWITFLSIATFDTYTDWQFSSKFGQRDILIVSLAYSLLIYNIASEFALMYGLQLAIGNAPDAIAGAIKTFTTIITSPFDGKKKPNQQQQQRRPDDGGGKQQQQPQQQRQKQRGGKQQQPQHGQRPPQGNGNNQQGRQQADPRTMMDPRSMMPPINGMPPGVTMPHMHSMTEEDSDR